METKGVNMLIQHVEMKPYLPEMEMTFCMYIAYAHWELGATAFRKGQNSKGCTLAMQLKMF